MKKVLMAAALAWIAGAAMLAQSTAPASAPRASSPSSLPPSSSSPSKAHRAWLDKNCVGCHNTRSPQPPNDPLNLETASLDNVLPHAATWERVLRKLGARAMPPQI